LSVAFAVAVDATVSRPTPRRAAALAACTTAGLLTHYFFLFTVIAGLAWVWLEREAGRARRRVAAAVFVGGGIALGFVPLALSQIAHDHFWWIRPFALNAVLSLPLHIFSPLSSVSLLGALVASVTLGLVVTAAWSTRRFSRQRVATPSSRSPRSRR
jgi:hypothetical protein